MIHRFMIWATEWRLRRLHAREWFLLIVLCVTLSVTFMVASWSAFRDERWWAAALNYLGYVTFFPVKPWPNAVGGWLDARDRERSSRQLPVARSRR